MVANARMRVVKPAFGLTQLEWLALIGCYSDGLTEAAFAELHKITESSVKHAIRRACDKIVSLGMPHPKPYGRGSRAEIRAVCPSIDRPLVELDR